MSLYEKKEDFIKRTKENLETIEDEMKNRQQSKDFYEVTHMINYCLGLIAFPHEILKPQKETTRSKSSYVFSHKKYGDILLCLSGNGSPTTNFASVLRHMRNAICHGRITTNTVGKYITHLHFHDYGKMKGGKKLIENFHIVMSIKQLPVFANEVISHYEKISQKKI